MASYPVTRTSSSTLLSTRPSTRKSQKELLNIKLLNEAQKGNLDDVRMLLLQSRADINSQGEDSRTALCVAALNNDVNIVAFLLQQKADFERKDKEGRTPLSWVAKNGLVKIVNLLLEEKANFETQDRNNQTPLSLAAQEGRIDVVRPLLQKNATVATKDLQARTPLLLAVESDHPEVVELLLETNAPINDSVGKDPLPWAAKNGHVKIVQLLLEKNAQIKGSVGQDRLPWAAKNGHLRIVQLLLDQSAELEGEDEHKRAPLSLAARYGYAQIVKLLLQKKANIEKGDEEARTPLSLAAERGHTEVAQLLLENEAKIEEECSGQTPLSFAAENGNLQIVKLLLEKRAEIKTKNEHDQTPFDLAKKNGHDKVAALLLRHESKGDWTVEQLCSLISLHNQDLIVEEIKMWPKAAKQIQKRQGGVGSCSVRRAALPEPLRLVLAPNEKDPTDPRDKYCAAIIDSENVDNLLKDSYFSAPESEVPVMLKVLPGVTGRDAINEEFLRTVARTPHERIFETEAIQAMILAAWQQKFLWTRLEIVSCTMMVISLCFSSYGFRHDSFELAEKSLWVAAVLLGQKSLNALWQLGEHLVRTCCGLWKSSRSYINFDNVADLLYIGSGWAAITCKPLSCPSRLEKPWMAMFCALSWLRLLYCLRGEDWMGPRLLPILSAMKDANQFLSLLAICIVAASHAYYILEIRDLEIRGEAWPTYAAFMQIVRLGIFNDFDMFEFEGEDPTYILKDADNASVWEPKDPHPGPHYESVHALFYITGLGINLLLMNVLISVLSENYSKYGVKEKAIGQFLRARVGILVNVQSQPERLVWRFLMRLCRPWTKKHRRQNAQSIAQCPTGHLQTSIEQIQCNASENSTSQEEEGSTRNGLLGLLRLLQPRKRRRAAAKQCAIFFVVRDEPGSNDIQSLRTQLEQRIELLDCKLEMLEHKLGEQIETGFKQMGEQIAGQTRRRRRRRRSSRSEHVSPFEMQADDG